MVDTSVLLDGSLGAFVGAIITGSAQVWSYRQGRKDTRRELSIGAARDLLDIINDALDVIRQLPNTADAGGSPLSYGQRLDISQQMRATFRKARLTTVPVLNDKELRRRFVKLETMFNVLCSPSTGYEQLYPASNEVVKYAHDVADCLAAHINGHRLPAEPELALPELRSGGSWPD